jgi:hypothetical protein
MHNPGTQTRGNHGSPGYVAVHGECEVTMGLVFSEETREN